MRHEHTFEDTPIKVKLSDKEGNLVPTDNFKLVWELQFKTTKTGIASMRIDVVYLSGKYQEFPDHKHLEFRYEQDNPKGWKVFTSLNFKSPANGIQPTGAVIDFEDKTIILA